MPQSYGDGAQQSSDLAGALGQWRDSENSEFI